MKHLITSSVILLALCSINPAARADSDLISLKTGTVTDVLIDTPILNGDSFVYTHTDVGLLGLDGGLLSASTSVFTATYVDALGTLGVLNVTDVCTTVDILGPATPCQAFAFSFTDLTLGDASLIAAVGLDVDASVSGDVANFDIAAASIGGGTGTFNFQNPPPPPAATPEPNSLCLLGTGLLAAAGMLRRRMFTGNPLAVVNS